MVRQLALLSSTSYILAALILASGHPGFEICCTSVLYTVLYGKVHKSTTTYKGHTRDHVRQTHELTYMIGLVNVHTFASLKVLNLEVHM